MSYKDLADKLVDKLNKNNKPLNTRDHYELGIWYYNNIYSRAVIYHYGGRCTDKGWGAIIFTPAGQYCKTYELACEKMLKNYYNKYYNIQFDSIEELQLKLAIKGLI